LKNIFISNDTKKKLKELRKLKSEIPFCSQGKARKLLLKTGLYKRNGELKN
jgi:hypothetical protein